VSKVSGKLTVHKHIGSFEGASEKLKLQKEAQDYIEKNTGQTTIFDVVDSIKLNEIVITDSKPLFAYNLLSRIYDKLGFNRYQDEVIKDLVIARIYHPTSKLETQEILSDFFGRHYGINTLYRHLKKGLKVGMKEVFQDSLILFAKNELKDTLQLVFYDVTTLYFESGIKGGLRDFGFSKEHRTQDTQVVVGLVVNQHGFPLYFDVFSGKTFEGHTFIPIVENVLKILKNPKLVIVADAAMISQANVDRLVEKNIGFIVGARVANLPLPTIEEISKTILGTDGATCTIQYKGQRLVCSYSAKRASKDRSDREKQIAKAEQALSSPSTLARRYRFVTAIGKQYQLNSTLILKAKKLEGIKGFLTNTELPASLVIERYKDLWNVEHSFRITKSDLKARPIFHRLDEAIQAHLVLVFAGLAISKYIELQSGLSIHKALKISRKILTHKVINSKTGQVSFIQTSTQNPTLSAQIDALNALGH
jgi:transposase